MLEDGVTTETGAGAGTPQGPPIASLLANIALHVLDAERKFADIDSYAHERLAIFASTKRGLRYHRNWTHRFTWGLVAGLGVYRLSGRVRSGAAYVLR